MPERDTLVKLAETRGRTVGEPVKDPVSPSHLPGAGRVVAVNVSPGGVPKLPVTVAGVHLLGLDGDDHDDKEGHGGPTRAVCLLGLEAIRRVAAEGHPISPGAAGENLTTEGIELGALPYGSRLAIGPEVVLELTSAANPCRTIAHNFSDGRFVRISIKLHPLDTRVYASVVREGVVRPGDYVTILPDDANG